MTTTDYIRLEDRYGAHNYHPLDVILQKAKGVWVYDINGKKYLDCLSAYSALNHGHCHPTIRKAVIDQMRRVTLTSRAFRNDQLPFLYKTLHDLTGYSMSLPMNSGAEAVETAIKAARKWGYKIKGIPEDDVEIICCSGNFHGRTTTIISFSTEDQYRDGFGPFTPGFRVVKYGDIADLSKHITPNTAAFLVEPIQGEAGIVVPPEGYLREAARICKENNVLFIADEIQTGLGRTGKLFAFEYENIRPDAVIIGKALGGGYYPGDHGSTFGGNPVACAAAISALKVLVHEKLVKRSFETGKYFMRKLGEIKSSHIKEIRGRGLLIGVVLDAKARPYCEALAKNGLLCKETHESVIRFAPPLVITRNEIDWACKKIAAVMMELD